MKRSGKEELVGSRGGVAESGFFKSLRVEFPAACCDKIDPNLTPNTPPLGAGIIFRSKSEGIKSEKYAAYRLWTSSLIHNLGRMA
jgi:hypothetical protein